jgi:hypothetical protein
MNLGGVSPRVALALINLERADGHLPEGFDLSSRSDVEPWTPSVFTTSGAAYRVDDDFVWRFKTYDEDRMEVVAYRRGEEVLRELIPT